MKFWTHFYFESHSSCSILNLNLSQNENFENQLLPQIFHQKTSNILWTQSCKHHDGDISNIKRNIFFTYLHIYFHMTLIQIQSKFCLKKIIFSHRTGKIGAIWMHTGPLEGQNVLEFIDQHLALSSTAILFQENKVFMPY